MLTPITVNYTRDGRDWKLTATMAEHTLRAQAHGLIAARDKADQLIEQLDPDEETRTVVHLLDGDAFAFTEAYLQARHGGTGGPAGPATADTAPGRLS